MRHVLHTVHAVVKFARDSDFKGSRSADNPDNVIMWFHLSRHFSEEDKSFHSLSASTLFFVQIPYVRVALLQIYGAIIIPVCEQQHRLVDTV